MSVVPSLGALRRAVERRGRAALVRILGLLFGASVRPVALGTRPRILVVRLDERVGNLVLVTPLLSSLRERFPGAEIELLAHHRGMALLGRHPALSRYVPFDKRRLLGRDGPLRTPFAIRRRRYDLVIDAANPTDPSTTQAVLVLLSGAPHRVGHAEGAFARFYSAPVATASAGPHEIDMRLALLEALPGRGRVRATSLGPLARGEWPDRRYAVVNVGARLGEKRLAADSYAAVARRVIATGMDCVLTWGPGERPLADEASRGAPGSVLAPPTGLTELASILAGARAVVTCDTGPMHVAVAAGVPTCGLFVATEPGRYGYDHPPHRAIDARGRDPSTWLGDVEAWLRTHLGSAASTRA